MAKSRIAFDTNIWISFTIGKRLSSLREILLSGDFEIYYCTELAEEYFSVANRKKFAKYINKTRISETLDLMESFAVPIKITPGIIHPTDIKDSYLLSLCKSANLNFLVTGDDDLLRLKKFDKTEIITFNQFNLVQKRN